MARKKRKKKRTGWGASYSPKVKGSLRAKYNAAKREYKRLGVQVFKQGHQGRTISQMPKRRKRKKSRARRSR
jgi:hypothetical protein